MSEAARRRRRRNCRYNLRQLSALSAPEAKIKPYQVNLPRLPPEVLRSGSFHLEEPLRETSEVHRVASWISPGLVSPQTPDSAGYDSIDELIRSSSDDECFDSYS